ncbi:MAG: reductive dehalogenase [Dehalococcoidia bacterium]|nr:MAG: reductive dehalogenase [Dehalococcoidia bacterium]
MSKYHSILSRREFLKALGMGSAGLGALAVAPPAIRDMDEVIASPQADWKRPAWVKEVDKPTVEIDWKILERFDYREVMFVNGFTKAVGKETAGILSQVGLANAKKWIRDKRPGHTLKDYAVKMGAQGYAFDPHSYLGYKKSPTPESLGVPRWEGTPEENARMVRTVMRLYGAVDVAYVELDTDTTEKLIYTYDVDGKQMEIKDVELGEESEKVKILPKKARWVIVYTMMMSHELTRRLPSFNAEATVYMPYAQGPWLQDRFQDFIRTLGYNCYGEPRPNALGTSVGLGVMGGLGEISRIEHIITPGRGFSHRVFKMITDLPLAPTKPIDTGVMDFCRVCKKCSDMCPAHAIAPDTEPTWKIPGPYKNPGVKGWFRIEPLCYTYWRQTGTGCGFCLALCPLNRPQNTSYFKTMRSTIAKTTALNRTFRKMDDLLDWGPRRDPAGFWDLEMPSFGWD